MSHLKLAMLVAALAAALIAAGCGGDDDDDDIADRAALIQEADAICAEGDREIDAEAQDVFGGAQQEPPPAEQEAFVEDTVIPNIQDQIDQLRELDPPDEDADEFTAILDEAQAALDELEQDPAAFVGGGQNPFAEVNQMAREFGLEECGG
jgi:hypothetical protein